jgi:hypothetical protein
LGAAATGASFAGPPWPLQDATATMAATTSIE